MLFKGKTTEQIEFVAEIEINASAETIFEALNFRSPNNRYWRRNMEIHPVAGTTDKFDLCDPRVPDMVFRLTEVYAAAPLRYDVRTEFPGGEPLGVLLGDESFYEIQPLSDGRCLLSSDVRFETIPMDKEQRDEEFPMLVIAVNDDLARLKALIEEGAEQADKAGALDEVFEFIEEQHICAAE